MSIQTNNISYSEKFFISKYLNLNNILINTNFNNDLEMPKQSYGQDLIAASAGHINEQTILANAKDMAQRKENSRKSNFDVGHIAAKSNKDKYAVDTASRAAFKPEELANFQRTQGLKKNFKGGKLYMGSSGNDYSTTNHDNFSEELL